MIDTAQKLIRRAQRANSKLLAKLPALTPLALSDDLIASICHDNPLDILRWHLAMRDDAKRYDNHIT
jgi:hypothetical protein